MFSLPLLLSPWPKPSGLSLGWFMQPPPSFLSHSPFSSCSQICRVNRVILLKYKSCHITLLSNSDLIQSKCQSLYNDQQRLALSHVLSDFLSYSSSLNLFYSVYIPPNWGPYPCSFLQLKPLSWDIHKAPHSLEAPILLTQLSSFYDIHLLLMPITLACQVHKGRGSIFLSTPVTSEHRTMPVYSK